MGQKLFFFFFLSSIRPGGLLRSCTFLPSLNASQEQKTGWLMLKKCQF